jgi:hypothetical protein
VKDSKQVLYFSVFSNNDNLMQNPQASSAAVIRNASERSILLDTDIETDRFFPQCQKDVTVKKFKAKIQMKT